MKTNNWLTNKYIAHRGLFDNKAIPENTLPAFERAVEMGFAIELDVQMTADGVLVVFHDDTLERMTALSGDIRQITYLQLMGVTLLDTNVTIPTLEQVLNTVDGKTPLLIEIKAHQHKVGVVEQKVADALCTYKGEFAIESFNPIIIRWFRKHHPSFVCGQLASELKDAPLPKLTIFLLKHLLLCRWNGSRFVAYDVQSIAKMKRVAKLRKKMPILCWTIRSQQQYKDTMQHYDNIIFDSFLPVADEKNKEKQL
ncbi:MAG: glycerophosphodiester phosphodiesterase [Clostridia bacterium]|nr:glycerophosphodiester phosphodiesterase [Clostridia bacterium]